VRPTRERVDPRRATVLIDNELPTKAKPSTASEAPKRKNDRIDTDAPKLTMLKTDNVEPHRA